MDVSCNIPSPDCGTQRGGDFSRLLFRGAYGIKIPSGLNPVRRAGGHFLSSDCSTPESRLKFTLGFKKSGLVVLVFNHQSRESQAEYGRGMGEGAVDCRFPCAPGVAFGGFFRHRLVHAVGKTLGRINT